MKQGTVSVLFGCHSIVHSILVIRSWKKVNGTAPKFWQVCCIFLHDIGHWGLDYLDCFEEKKKHWKLGAEIARRLFGDKGYNLTAGHCEYSGIDISVLYKADKYSWHIAPVGWLIWNIIPEPKLQMGYPTKRDAVRKFKSQVAESIESNQFVSTHKLYLERIGKLKND